MQKSLLYWHQLYTWLKSQALCLDIETTDWGGPVAVVGLYRPKEGPVEYESYVKGQNLDARNLKAAFDGCKLLITYNGLAFDVPKIQEEFPGVIPADIPVLDLYLFARRLGWNTSLRVLEDTFHISRLTERSKEKGNAVRLWRRYEDRKDAGALQDLLEYNRQDTVNLHPLAEHLTRQVYRNLRR